MIPHRLTFDVDEETRARWQLAADREQMTLIGWITDTCQVASDPESGTVVPPGCEDSDDLLRGVLDWYGGLLPMDWQVKIAELLRAHGTWSWPE